MSQAQPTGLKISGRSVGPLSMVMHHGPSGATIQTTPPVDNGGDGSSFSPTDLCAASLGACASTIILLAAPRHQIPLAGINFDLVKQMNQSPRRLGRLIVTYVLDTDCTEESFAVLVAAGRACPVRLTLGPDVLVEERYVRASDPAERTSL